MKKYLLASTILVASAFGAIAADLPARVPAAAPAPVFVANSWTGVYVGAQVGYFDSVVKQAGNLQLTGTTFGLRAGYDHQFGNVVFGAFVEGAHTTINRTLVLGLATIEVPYTLAAIARVGYLITPSTLGYVTGGYQYSRTNINLLGIAAEGVSARGLNVGAGLEHRFTSAWSFFGEYRYSQTRLDNDTVDVNSHRLNIGLNYRFGGAGSAVVAKY